MEKYNIDDLLNEADIAISNPTWTVATSCNPKLFDAKAVLEGVLRFSFGPIGEVLIAGIKFINKKKKEKVAKELAIQKLVAKQNELLRALEKENRENKERIESLTQLNELLKEAILKLQEA